MNNPFYYNQPVQVDDFVGRWSLVEEIVADLTNPRADSWAIIGGRRFGKTSVLNAISARLWERFNTPGQVLRYVLPQKVDLGKANRKAESCVYMTILRELHQTLVGYEPFALRIPETRLNTVVKSEIDECPINDFEQVLRDLARRLDDYYGSVRLAFLLDEAESLAHLSWFEDLLDNLRALVYDGDLADKVKLILVGSTQLWQISQRGSPLLNMVNKRFLAPLTMADLQQLISRAGDISEEVSASVQVQSGGHPFITQYLLYYLWKDGELQATSAEVELKARQMRQERSQDFDWWWKAIGNSGQRAYALLVQAEDWQNEKILLAQVGDAMIPIDEGLRALCYHGLVERDSSLQRYRAVGTLYRDWVLQTRLRRSL